jgi:hypothetical protein
MFISSEPNDMVGRFDSADRTPFDSALDLRIIRFAAKADASALIACSNDFDSPYPARVTKDEERNARDMDCVA